MKTLLLATALSIIASPAMAAVVICQSPNCAPGPETNILVDHQPSANVIIGRADTNGGIPGVAFTSPIGEALVGNANGQADVTAADGVLNALTFTIQSGFTFGDALFNLFPQPGNQPNEAMFADISYFVNNILHTDTIGINTNGQNDTGVFGTAGERFTSITFRANPITTGIDDLRQLRLSDIQQGPSPPPPPPAVPEPAVWLTMLLGFGIIGSMLRRSPANARVRFA
jgi:hypothetical protein